MQASPNSCPSRVGFIRSENRNTKGRVRSTNWPATKSPAYTEHRQSQCAGDAGACAWLGERVRLPALLDSGKYNRADDRDDEHEAAGLTARDRGPEMPKKFAVPSGLGSRFGGAGFS
jgi:hypothetical protein